MANKEFPDDFSSVSSVTDSTEFLADQAGSGKASGSQVASYIGTKQINFSNGITASGITMSGTAITRSVDSSYLGIYGGSADDQGAGIVLYGDSDGSNPNVIRFVNGAFTEQARINATGNLVMASGKGINFGDETLQNYDEGTWTPVLYDTASNVTFTTTIQFARYIRIGNICTAQTYILVTNKTGSGGTATNISGLPFTSINTSTYATVGIAQGVLLSSISGLLCNIGQNISVLSLRSSDPTGYYAALNPDNVASNSEFIVSLTYEVQ